MAKRTTTTTAPVAAPIATLPGFSPEQMAILAAIMGVQPALPATPATVQPAKPAKGAKAKAAPAPVQEPKAAPVKRARRELYRTGDDLKVVLRGNPVFQTGVEVGIRPATEGSPIPAMKLMFVLEEADRIVVKIRKSFSKNVAGKKPVVIEHLDW